MEKILSRQEIRKNEQPYLGDTLTDQIDSNIQDIPSIKEKLKLCNEFETIMKVPMMRSHLKHLGIDVDLIYEQCLSIKEIASTLDRFDNLFSGLGWIAYWNIDTKVLKGAVAKGDSGDIEGAQGDLVSHYSPDRIQFELKRMSQIKAFQARMPLARKALIDYREERYHACVPVVLALLDGMINEACQKKLKKRCGFFAENADLIAWDSVAGHSKGLNELARTFRSGRYKTTTYEIDIPYRNGILHGMDLSYDNKIVAAKTWAALFAASEWVLRAEQDLLTPPKPENEKTPLEIILDAAWQHEQTKKEQAIIAEWKPRSLKLGQDLPATGNPDEYEIGSPERRLIEFFFWWKAKNYGYMSECILKKLGNNAEGSLSDIRKRFDQNHLQSYQLDEICDTASPRSLIKAKLILKWYGRIIEKSFDFILMNYDESLEPAMRGTPGSKWYVYNWNWYF